MSIEFVIFIVIVCLVIWGAYVGNRRLDGKDKGRGHDGHNTGGAGWFDNDGDGGDGGD